MGAGGTHPNDIIVSFLFSLLDLGQCQDLEYLTSDFSGA